MNDYLILRKLTSQGHLEHKHSDRVISENITSRCEEVFIDVAKETEAFNIIDDID